MKIKLYWPKCNYLNRQWMTDGIDSYWVECAYQEAEDCIFPYLSPEQIAESKKIWEPEGKKIGDSGIETNRICYLVAKDLSSIEPFPGYYPYSGMWNAYCPFQSIDEIEISELGKLSILGISNDGSSL